MIRDKCYNNNNIHNNNNNNNLNTPELNHLIYAAATVITEEINGTGECKTQRSKTPPWVRRIQGSINDITKGIASAGGNKKR